ncbi:Spo0B domain-containing protein [Frigoribacterium sp. CFBP 13729]|uniref:sensor histidine kinase n=1 Tax=Frigoribacterium sp. CFBP 13729 TaxID=2775293 RepID=UPI0017829912|nr:ATP-binding protein [Frigoribacterium sp. CFBP 13729]MBD8610397.1 Spo0B domain-containing protein [Frigoribacterium sp. CFBP 13729]
MRRASIATRLFALQVVGVVVLALVAGAWQWTSARTDTERAAAARCTALATSIADNPFVLEALDTDDPSAVLEPYALDLMRDTDTDFVTVMTTDRTRLTHPDPAEIGRPFIGTIAPALAGRSFTETYSGTLGPSVRAVVPVLDDAGDVVALVAAGVTVDSVSAALGRRLPLLVGGALATVALGALAAWLLSRHLRRVTRGLGAEELGRVSDHHEAVLHSVGEGLVLVDDQGRLTLANDHAALLLGLPSLVDDVGRRPVPVSELALPTSLAALLAGGDEAQDEVHVADDRVLVVNQRVAAAPAPGAVGGRVAVGRGAMGRGAVGGRRGAGRALGTVTTLRDHTELRQLTDELRTMSTLSAALRSQTHEFANRLHTIVALIELGRADEALRFASDELDLGQVLADQVVAAVDEPVLAALLLGKSAQARERAVELELHVSPDFGSPRVPVRDLVTVLGNLVDNALDAAAPRWADAGTDVDVEGTDAGPEDERTVNPVVDDEPRNDGVDRPRRDASDRRAAGSAGGTGRAGPATVRVSLDRPAAGVLRIAVSDSGPGLPGGRDVFERGVSTKAGGAEGRGIGLALVAQVARRAGGTVDARSTVHGTTITVDLPDDEEAVVRS